MGTQSRALDLELDSGGHLGQNTLLSERSREMPQLEGTSPPVVVVLRGSLSVMFSGGIVSVQGTYKVVLAVCHASA